MRTLFLLLLLANLAFFAWVQYLSPPDPYSDPRPLAREIAPGRLPLLPPAGGTAPRS